MSAPPIYLHGVEPSRNRFNPLNVFAGAWEHRELIYRLARREVESRYKGSLLGLVWSFLVPLMMLGVYTFVFSTIFKVKWPIGDPNHPPPFFLIVFAGMIWLNLFVECVARAPSLILGNVTYVKKVVFPLEVLPIVTLAAELFNALIGLILLTGVYIAFLGRPHAVALLLPIVVLPLVLLILGLVWFISSLGVYLRDLRQLVAVLMSMIGLVSPLFYPLQNVPAKARWALYLNPLTVVLEQVRDVLFKNVMPDWRIWLCYLVVGWTVAWAGLLWFNHAQRGFADVI
jgi:lipopolysaccharide transport system permease protein